MNPVKNNEDYAQYYTWEGKTTVQLKGWAWWNMGMVRVRTKPSNGGGGTRLR